MNARLPFVVLVLALWSPGPTAASSPNPHPALGINLSGPSDWNTELPFVDVFRLSRVWISQKRGEPWGKGPILDLDPQGWVRRLEADCFAETALCTISGGHYPSGDWTVLWDGVGRIELSKGRVLDQANGRMRVNIDSKGGGFFLRLLATDPAQPVRNIRVLMPGFPPETAASNPWHPAFLARWKGMACLRFMDFQDTNNSKQRQWSDRPHVGDATCARNGIPVEWLCDLANRLDADAWFCIPHLADDAYVRAFAQLVNERLKPGLRAWVEYSNEVWNGQFEQQRHAAQQGIKLGFAGKPWEAAWRYTAQRSVEIFKIWDEVLGGRNRLVRVLASQAANAYVATQIAGWKDAGHQADALAIAPYLSMNIPKDGKNLTAREAATWSVDRFLDQVESQALPESTRWIASNRKVADDYGLRLVAYEAGQHFVGVGGAENVEELTRLLLSANSHPRMTGIYQRYFAAWEANGGDLLCHFSSVGGWSKWGSWGLLQYADEDPRQSPKFIATLNWARNLGQPVHLP